MWRHKGAACWKNAWRHSGIFHFVCLCDWISFWRREAVAFKSNTQNTQKDLVWKQSWHGRPVKPKLNFMKSENRSNGWAGFPFSLNSFICKEPRQIQNVTLQDVCLRVTHEFGSYQGLKGMWKILESLLGWMLRIKAAHRRQHYVLSL